MPNSRIPRDPDEFAPFMDNTDNLQLAIVPPSITANYVNWGWTQAQSAQWTAYRKQSDALFLVYSNKKQSNTENKEQMKILIETVEKYDHDPILGNHLLDRIAILGSVSDCTTFKVKRGTPLVLKANEAGPQPGTLIPVLTERLNTEGEHKLAVRNSQKPKSRAIPKGMKFCKVYRYIGTAAPTSISQYQFIVNAKRGLAISSFADIGLDPTVKLWAWYIARYESTKGVLGNPLAALKMGVLLQDGSPVIPVTPVPPVTK
jgi:hypothetical protein